MSWTLGGVRIYVQEKGSDGKQIIARLQPLAGITVKQIFGYEDRVTKISAIVVGETDLASLKTMHTTGSTYALVGYGTDYGDFLVASVSEKQRRGVIAQTLTADCDAPLFDVDIELM